MTQITEISQNTTSFPTPQITAQNCFKIPLLHLQAQAIKLAETS